MSKLLKIIAAKRRDKIRANLYNSIKRKMQTDSDKFLSIRDVCFILNIDLSSVQLSENIDPDEKLTGICAWDFYLLPGSLYAALPLYANLQADKAIEKGARVLLTDKQEGDYPCIVVSDVMTAYCKLCEVIRRRANPRTIAITGSVGKTTTKDMVRSICTQKFNVFCDSENNNMITLVGYLVQRIPRDCDCYVQEVHEGDAGSAENISKMIHPDIAIITNIGESHIGNFDSYEGFIKGVADITTGMPQNGLVVIDADDRSSVNVPWDRRVVKVSVKDPSVDYYAKNIRTTNRGLRFDIVFSKKKTSIELHMYGVHNVTDALLAFAAGVEAGVPPEKAAQGLKKYKPRGMRQNIIKVRNRILYIDCFNAAVKSMKTALDTLEDLPVKRGGKRIAVLGDIAELGDASEMMHREVGKMVAKANIDVLICYGLFAANIAEEAKCSDKLKVFYTDNLWELNELVKKNVGVHDAVLFKASHATNLIAAVKANYPSAYFRAVILDRLYRQMIRVATLK